MSDQLNQLKDKLSRLGPSQKKERIDLLVELAWENSFEKLEEGFALSQTALSLAREIDYKHGLAMVDRNLGFYYYAKSNFISAIQKSNAALAAFQVEGDKDEQANSLMILGLLYWSLGNFELSLEFLFKSEELFRETNNNKRLPWVLTTLGGVHENLRDTEKAIGYHKESLTYFRRTGDKLGEARALSGIGTVYQSQNKFKEGLEFEEKSLELFEALANRMGQSRAYNDIGMAYQGLGQLQKALDYHKKSLELRKQLKNKHAEISSFLNMGRVYNLMKKPGKALPLLRKGLADAEEMTAKPKIWQLHQALAEASELAGDLSSALEHTKSYQRVKDEVFSDETNTKLRNLEIQFQVEKTEREAEIHRLRNIELRNALDDLKAAQGQLVQTEKLAALGQLTAGIAHEINNPVGALKSAADLSLRGLHKIRSILNGELDAGEKVPGPSVQRTLEILEQNSKTMLTALERIAKIVRSLRNFARLDEAEYKRVDIHEGIESTLTLLQHRIPPGVKVVKNFGAVPPITVYPNQLNQVFMTILKNAIQAVDGEGQIIISTRLEKQSLLISIADSGKGMSRTVLDSLFDLSFNKKSSRVGIGMGLYNARNVAKRHGGDIQAVSEPGEGSEFILTLPLP